MSFSRPLAPLLCCGGALSAALVGTWAMGATPDTPVERMAPVVATVLPPLPPPDSLAKLLVSDDSRFRSSTATTSMLLEAIRVIDWIPSSSERADLLTEIAEFPDLDAEVVSAVGQSAAYIGSPGARSRVLRTLIRNHPRATEESRASVLNAIATMQSTPERAVTLELFVSSPGLSPQALADGIRGTASLRADNERLRVLLAAARNQRVEGRAKSAYLEAALGIRDQRYRNRALDALSGRRRDHEGDDHIPVEGLDRTT